MLGDQHPKLNNSPDNKPVWIVHLDEAVLLSSYLDLLPCGYLISGKID